METNRKYNLSYIRMCEETYSINKTSKSIIHKFYREYLKIGDGNILSDAEAWVEVRKLFDLAYGNAFKEKYNRDFNIVDMYLTTNFQVKDLLENYQEICKYTSPFNIEFIKKSLKEVDNAYSSKGFGTSNNIPTSRLTFSSRFYRPSQKGIKQICELNFTNYNPIVNASLEDVNEAHKILLDLNEKYGVKYDDVSLYIILKSYLNNEIDSYYQIAEEYKNELDKHSHVQKRCIPLLTRREKN